MPRTPGLSPSCLQSPPLKALGGLGWGAAAAMGHLSPEHVTDPQHVMFPSTLPVPGHSGYRLQPHEAPRTLQPTVVTSHHLPFVQHWSIPGEQRAQRGGEGQGRRQAEAARVRRIEKDRERHRGSQRPRGTSASVRDPLMPHLLPTPAIVQPL